VSPEDSLDLGGRGEQGEVVDGEVLAGDDGRMLSNVREESRFGVYLCPEADQDCCDQPLENVRDGRGGEEPQASLGWSLWTGGGLEGWGPIEWEVPECDQNLPSATRDFLCEL